MSATTRDKLQFVHAMGRHTRATVRQCEALMRYAATLQRLAEQQCNDPRWGEREYAKRDRIKARVADVIKELMKADPATYPAGQEYGAYFSNDPRGAVVKIRVPSGFSDSFGGEGIVVPS